MLAAAPPPQPAPARAAAANGSDHRVVGADGRAISAETLGRLERLDDTVFAALAGEPGALDEAEEAWRSAREAVDRQLLDEARLHYARRARSRWRQALARPEESLPLGFAAREILGLFGE